ncbi:selenoneine synthase SenA [Haloechinothrix sp. LS1_15]|uniref:selenoneine synthase SenA n=1 Tax=Haloechinothrix sp. LS1_15 TaxID=2652248 RepID=UPI002947CEC1|nr:selenoneine synthase SenA [Haloechinothrix sp. LS1_15]MDV6012876.1 ergothioneine biosynthesis protein EgtB [Haloechinothrix sp. LS1_15]
MEHRAVAADELASWVVDAAERAQQLVNDLTDEQLVGPLLPEVNPLIWEIGHIAWFQELFVLRRACGYEPILPHTDAIYDSGAIPHDTRWYLALPPREDTVSYMRTVAERVAHEVTAGTANDVVRHFARYTVHHHDTHTEAFTYTRQTLGLPAPALPGLTDSGATFGSDGTPEGKDVSFEGGRFPLGAYRADPFVYDNEKWAHPVDVGPFAMASTPVTQGEFAEFVDDGGYTTLHLWSDGGAWLAATGARHPVYWRRGPDGGWQRRHFDTWVALEPDLPVSHISWWEADAYCRWAGRRLPTEAEWEFAATAGRRDKPTYPWGSRLPEPEHAATDWRSLGPVPVTACAAGDSPDGCRQLIGNVWEWTASDFSGYPNFERDAYGDNSEQFFGHRKVLRGGGWPTRGRYIRATLRNYFTPDRRDVLAGFRTCPVTTP